MKTIMKVDIRTRIASAPSPALRQAETAVQNLNTRTGRPDTAVDRSGNSFLIVSFGSGENAALARAWIAEAAELGQVQWLTFSEINAETRRQLRQALASSLNGVRIMIVGRQFDVLQTVALARAAGALEKEVLSLVTNAVDLPIYCAHCRATSSVVGGVGDVVTCPACDRTVEIHAHLSGVRGSYLASDALARELP
ncbi:hypothetical protein DBZ45_09140 [Arthrobacter globiformis]|uniref:Dimethylamine monooxygenase subunit DmmA-like C-terminal domain-containing protein n=1 Tax=Arthrobacter globiformis TaxID=1665 RepID=A0A328HL68_ARTGO|nr:hypothetical protein DBZ45_09140 [Arthrobacter globiformis]